VALAFPSVSHGVSMRTHIELSQQIHQLDSSDGPTVLVTRGEFVESRHRVAYAMASDDGRIIASAGEIEEPVFMRSSSKPLVCAAIIASGAAKKFGFTLKEIAIIAGSHSGEPYHVATVLEILQKIGLDESALRCGSHPPFHEPSALALTAAGELPRAIHNNCSGKHAGMLAMSVHRGLEVDDYLSRTHPVQEEILAASADMLQVDPQEMPVAIDGCGTPVIAVPLRAGAVFYAKLSNTEVFGARWQAALSHVCRAMLSHPEYVGGTGRLDTDLMMSTPTLICKSGAEGYHATCMLAKNVGMAVKIIDGNDRAVSPFVVDVLISEKVVLDDQTARLERHRHPAVINHAREAVGEIVYPNGMRR
jgi:L-asparaginase II